jgi:hypothetical protein
MSKLAEIGILWLDDSQIYVADKKLFDSADNFLKAVFAHIKSLIDNYSENECGWCKMPNFNKYINRVTTSWVVHRINSDWHDKPFWENVEESGQGHVPVWYIDFEENYSQGESQ